jgi:hypothetical protein
MRRASITIAAVLAGLIALAAITAIATGTLSVVWPNGGETLYKGYMYKLQWSDTRTGLEKPETVFLSVYMTNSVPPYYFLEDYEVDNDGTPYYWWTVPCVEPWSELCRFKVADPPDHMFYQEDISDNPFTIRYLGDDP